MKKLNINLLLFFSGLLLFSLITGCQQSEYKKLEAAELAKGVRYDSLFLGMYLGMEQKDFFAYCWELNKQQIIRQGARNTTVEYEPEGMKFPAKMEFYPDFQEEKIYQMPVWFSYKSFSAWNKEFSADSLEADVIRLMERWHGEGFIKFEYPGKYPAHVKVDGNRRILVAKESDQVVKATFTDLLVENEKEKLAESK